MKKKRRVPPEALGAGVRSQFVPAVREGGAGLGGPQRLESRGNRLGERRTESGGGAGGRLGRCGGADVSRQRFSAAPKAAAVRGAGGAGGRDVGGAERGGGLFCSLQRPEKGAVRENAGKYGLMNRLSPFILPSGEGYTCPGRTQSSADRAGIGRGASPAIQNAVGGRHARPSFSCPGRRIGLVGRQ